VTLLENPKAQWDRPSFTCYGVNYSSVRGEQWHYIRYPNGKQELYNIVKDPFEFVNLLHQDQGKYDDIVLKMNAYIPELWRTELPGRWEDIQNKN
jgi:hypothetical protein